MDNTEALIKNNTQSTPLFFPVSVTKLLVLTFCTLNFYQLYWFFKNWQLIKLRERSNISITWRAILGPLFCYALFKRVALYAKSEINKPFSAAIWALLYFCSQISGFVITALSTMVFMSIIGAVLLIPVQRAVNQINAVAAPNHDPNTRFTLFNILYLVIFFSLLGLIIYYGFFAPH